MTQEVARVPSSILKAGDTAHTGTRLVLHIIHALDVGGMENGLVNLIRQSSTPTLRHAVLCLAHVDRSFAERLPPSVPIVELNRRPGTQPSLYIQMWRQIRAFRPDIVHTRNIAALEGQMAALLAGVPCRVHSEHGWDVFDPHGLSRKYRLLRRLFKPLVHRYVCVSEHIKEYLAHDVGLPAAKIEQIYNGVDTERFAPPAQREPLPVSGFSDRDAIVIGTVGRMHGVKDQATLARAFISLCRDNTDIADKLRLILIGDGPLRNVCENLLREAGLGARAWLPGSRTDVDHLLLGMDIFVLPSIAEGISNTILEAMATGLPVVATRVGGNPELVVHNQTGFLVGSGDPESMVSALALYARNADRRRRDGRQGRERVVRKFSLSQMVHGYTRVYDRVLRDQLNAPLAIASKD